MVGTKLEYKIDNFSGLLQISEFEKIFKIAIQNVEEKTKWNSLF